jgi:transcriptional regulator with XRE-family HTH domain
MLSSNAKPGSQERNSSSIRDARLPGAFADLNGMKSRAKDVAKMAGVSTTTVSRVANGDANVSRRTRSKVLSAISKLKYQPNEYAAELRRANCVLPKNLVDAQSICQEGAGLQLNESDYWRVKRRIADLRMDLERLIGIVQSIDRSVQTEDSNIKKTA